MRFSSFSQIYFNELRMICFAERAREQKAILIGMKLALWCISYVWRHYFMTFRGPNSHSHEDFFREESAVLYTTNIQQNNVFFLLVNWTGPRFTQTSNIIHIIFWMLGMYSTHSNCFNYIWRKWITIKKEAKSDIKSILFDCQFYYLKTVSECNLLVHRYECFFFYFTLKQSPSSNKQTIYEKRGQTDPFSSKTRYIKWKAKPFFSVSRIECLLLFDSYGNIAYVVDNCTKLTE